MCPLEMLRNCFTDYWRAVREAKSQYLSNIISSSSHCLKMLFDTINAVVLSEKTPVRVSL